MGTPKRIGSKWNSYRIFVSTTYATLNHNHDDVSDKSKIEWTDATWNPVRDCTKISPGCLHCYAETFAERWSGVPGHPFELGFDLRTVPEKLGDPLRWGTPRMIFVNSMSDLFHEGVPDEYIIKVARVMVAANWHTYQVLTKRADRLAALLKGKLRFAAEQSHIWWGVSVENKKHGLPGLICCALHRQRSDFFRLSRCSKTSGRSNSRASRGQSWAAKAAPAHAR